MEIKKLSFINIWILAALLCAVILPLAVSRYSTVNKITFQASQELIVYPNASIVRTTERTVSKVETLPAPNVAPLVLPILPPKVLFQVLPEFPKSVKAGGSLVLRALVSSSGNVDRVEIRSSSGNELLDRSAASAVSAWKFSPARRGAESIASWFEVPVRFEMK